MSNIKQPQQSQQAQYGTPKNIRQNRNEYIQQTKTLPTSNPIRSPSPDYLLREEKIPMTSNPGL